jgi:hypothetical protein
VTEQDWLTCTDPQPMLDFLRGKASDRKLRLFACACCRRVWHLLTEERTRRAAEVAERFAEGSASDRERIDAWDNALEVAYSNYNPDEDEPRTDLAAFAVLEALDINVSTALGAVEASILALERTPSRAWPNEGIQMRGQVPLCLILRDIIGNPFCPVSFDLARRTPNVTAVAQTIYEQRRFEDLPILADALEEAGCACEEILEHCRSGGEHVKGCWAVDLVLGKE